VSERTSAAARGELGKIRLAYTFALASETLPVLLEAFAAEASQVTVTTREMYGADIPSNLREDKLDLALTPRLELGDDLGREPIRREPFVVSLSENHPLASAAAIDLAALRNEVFHGWPAAVSPGYHAAVITACHAAGFEPKIDETSTGSTAWNNIAAGRGVALTVASAVPLLRSGIAHVSFEVAAGPHPPRRRLAARQRTPGPKTASRDRAARAQRARLARAPAGNCSAG
jgi:DNA-binding transcriptional LysR family regulator